MWMYVLKRVFFAAVTLALLVTALFFLVRLLGDPAETLVSPYATPQDVMILRKHMGLDQPLLVQYRIYVVDLVHGDLGPSRGWGVPVSQLILSRAPASFQLAVAAMVISVMIGLPVGVISAVKKDSLLDVGGKIIALLGQALPAFWLGIVLMLIFAVKLRLLPTSGMGSIQHMILPAFTMGWYLAAGIMRLVRASMLDVLDSEYIKMARIKGLSERAVILKHALRNALIAPLTYASILFVALLAGAVVAETVFNWPGLGRLVYQAAQQSDYGVVQGVIIFVAVCYLVLNVLVDIVYVYLDPRIRYQKR